MPIRITSTVLPQSSRGVEAPMMAANAAASAARGLGRLGDQVGRVGDVLFNQWNKLDEEAFQSARADAMIQHGQVQSQLVRDMEANPGATINEAPETTFGNYKKQLTASEQGILAQSDPRYRESIRRDLALRNAQLDKVVQGHIVSVKTTQLQHKLYTDIHNESAQGNPGSALARLRSGMNLVDPEELPQLQQDVVIGAVTALIRSGDTETAEQIVNSPDSKAFQARFKISNEDAQGLQPLDEANRIALRKVIAAQNDAIGTEQERVIKERRENAATYLYTGIDDGSVDETAAADLIRNDYTGTEQQKKDRITELDEKILPRIAASRQLPIPQSTPGGYANGQKVLFDYWKGTVSKNDAWDALQKMRYEGRQLSDGDYQRLKGALLKDTSLAERDLIMSAARQVQDAIPTRLFGKEESRRKQDEVRSLAQEWIAARIGETNKVPEPDEVYKHISALIAIRPEPVPEPIMGPGLPGAKAMAKQQALEQLDIQTPDVIKQMVFAKIDQGASAREALADPSAQPYARLSGQPDFHGSRAPQGLESVWGRLDPETQREANILLDRGKTSENILKLLEGKL